MLDAELEYSIANLIFEIFNNPVSGMSVNGQYILSTNVSKKLRKKSSCVCCKKSTILS